MRVKQEGCSLGARTVGNRAGKEVGGLTKHDVGWKKEYGNRRMRWPKDTTNTMPLTGDETRARIA
jgi:hypothetical protein